MKNNSLKLLVLLCTISLTSCSQNDETVENEKLEVSTEKIETEPHKYGGWYCPDNLNGFPPVDIANWKNVPVVNNRMGTKEDSQNGSSLIVVDLLKYPNAKVLDITVPKLASIYNEYSKREDLIIVIQAINVDNDSIVGFRYLNGGNGSARLKEVKFLTDDEIAIIPKSNFVTYNVSINAPQDEVWEILTNSENAESLQTVFDKDNNLTSDWRESSNVNYHYEKTGALISSFANKLFGNFYVQNDYEYLQHNQKFLLIENEITKNTELKIVCGPFESDFNTQKVIIEQWAKMVKELSEK